MFYEDEDKLVKAVGHYINFNVTLSFKAEQDKDKQWNLTLKREKWLELRDRLNLLLIDIEL